MLEAFRHAPREPGRVVPATHGRREVPADPAYELDLTAELRGRLGPGELVDLFRRHATGTGFVDTLMRRCALRAVSGGFGHGVVVMPLVSVRHPETFMIGHGVFLGEQTVLQGRFDGRCHIGDGAWIGPQCFIDARDLEIGEHVGIGPGVRILGSEHTALPSGEPIIRTDLVIRPVRIEPWADLGMNASILPGITVGKGAIVGAGAVVTQDVPDFAKVAGVPARIIGWRDRPEGRSA